MCIAQENRELCELESKLWKKVAIHWKMLRDTVTQPIMFAFMIHLESWGHLTKSWKRANLPPRILSQQQQQRKNHPVIPAPPPSLIDRSSCLKKLYHHLSCHPGTRLRTHMRTYPPFSPAIARRRKNIGKLILTSCWMSLV